MTFFESASFIGSQVIANHLIDGKVNKNIKSVWSGAAVLAVVSIIYVTRGWQEAPQTVALKDYRVSFHRHVTSGMCIDIIDYTSNMCMNMLIF